MTVLAYAIATLCIAATVIPLRKHEAWWVRACDFPRIQIVLVTTAVLLILWLTPVMHWGVHMAFVLMLVAVLVYQLSVIAPYTRLWTVEMQDANSRPDERVIRILVCNVLMSNRDSERLIRVISKHDPDVLLAVEVDSWWGDQLARLAPDYPFRLEHPLENTYGIILFSKLELVDPELRFLIKEGVPSIRTGVRLRSGEVLRLHCLHPEPPSPGEAETSLPRDAELVMVGREIEASQQPTIVAGDLNDVAWSHTSRLFRRVSQLLDPRIGRGMFNTYHAGIWPLRWPLDHVFLSEEFLLHNIKRLPAFGSDHFPILIAAEYRPAAAAMHEAPQTDSTDEAEIDDKLERTAADSAVTASR